jgi:hypothetical protein
MVLHVDHRFSFNDNFPLHLFHRNVFMVTLQFYKSNITKLYKVA